MISREAIAQMIKLSLTMWEGLGSNPKCLLFLVDVCFLRFYVVDITSVTSWNYFINEVRASGHVAMYTSINKALQFRFLENESVMLGLWIWPWSHDNSHKPH